MEVVLERRLAGVRVRPACQAVVTLPLLARLTLCERCTQVRRQITHPGDTVTIEETYMPGPTTVYMRWLCLTLRVLHKIRLNRTDPALLVLPARPV